MEKLYKYVGILVVSLLVVTFLIRLFHLNTQVIEGLTVKQVKEQKKEKEELEKKDEGTPFEKMLLKISKLNDQYDQVMKSMQYDDKEVTEDILVELDELCDKSILFGIILISQDGYPDIQYVKGNSASISGDMKLLLKIEQLMTFKKAIAQSMKYITSNKSASETVTSTGGMFS